MKIGIQWWIGIYKVRVKRDLNSNPNIKARLPKSLIKGFINWSANQRIAYVEDLDSEVTDYLNDVYAKNLSWLNNKKKYKFYEKTIKRDGEYCKYCNSKNDLTLDHIIPRSMGGLDELYNLQILCRKCNSSKGNR